MTTIEIGGVNIEMVRRSSSGRPLLFLHPGIGIAPDAPVLDRLAAGAQLIAPSHPGFGRSDQPPDMNTVDDLAYFYLDLLEALDFRDTILVGVSFGGWIAAEIAVKSTERIGHIVLADALGIKVSGRETADILDIFNAHPDDVARARWREPQRYAIDFDRMSDEEIARHARDRESLCLYGWHPYMHNPHLARWLHRIRVPTLVLWGAEDRIVAPAYGRAYAGLIPGARFAMIDGAGHHPEQEQPEAFAARLLAFLEG